MLNLINKRKSNYTPNNKDGFTLIEVMIVLLIGGLLIAGAWGGYRFYQNTQVSQSRTKAGHLKIQLEMYKNEIGAYPQDLRELVEGPTDPKLRRGWGAPYASEKDLQDAWGREFVYELNPKGTRPPFEIYSTGPAGETKINPQE